MAKISNTAGSANIWLGSKQNSRQSILYVPGALTAEKPGLLFLESTDGTTAGGLYVWADSSNLLRFASTYPTDEDSDGSVLGTTSASSATRTLENLATTTLINSSLVSDTDSTDDLGSGSVYWANGYIDTLYLRSDATIASGASARLDFVGDIQVGVSGTGNDFTLFADTAGSYIKWSAAGNTNVGTLLIQDDAMFLWGDSSDITMTWVNGGGFEIDAAADDSVILSGASADIDWSWQSNAIAGQDMGWIADIGTFQLCDDTILNIGGAAVLTADDGFAFVFIPGSTPSTLNLDPTNANDLFRVGETNVADVQFDGANYNIIWNASDNAYIFQDSAELTFGTVLDIYMRWENTGETLDIGQTSDGTGSVDFIDIPVLMTGANNAGTLLTIAGVDIGGDSDTVSITHQGSGFALKIESVDVDSVQLGLLAEASQTHSMAIIDGESIDWIGAADNCGMVSIIHGSTALAHIGGTMLYVASSAQQKASAEGTLARFLVTGAAQAGAAAVEISANAADDALHVSSGIAKFSGILEAAASLTVATTSTFTGDATFLGGANCITGGADGATQGAITLWDGGGSNTPAYILMHSANGTAHYLFFEDDHTLKVHTGSPTQNSDGDAIGPQTD